MRATPPGSRSLLGSLRGRVVVVTRPREQADRLVALLEERGATALVAPTIRVVPAPRASLQRAVRSLSDGLFEWVVFTSAAGVEAVFEALTERPPALPALAARVAAVGTGTAATLRARGVEPDLVPGTFTTSALGRAIPRGSGRVLLPRADIAPDGLEAALSAKGWTPVRVDAYRTQLAGALPDQARRALQEGRIDAVTFTSASTVQGFLRAAASLVDDIRTRRATEPRSRRRPKLVSIGPVTSAALRSAGMSPDAVARPHTIEGLVVAVERALAPPGGPGRKESR